MESSSCRVLVVEDSKPFRKFVCSVLEKKPECQIVGELSDGLEAVQKAEELHPDLILVDIGLPSLNGIEAARRICKLSPESKILFVSQESSVDVVQEALKTGARGYVVKVDARSELLEAVNAVLRGERFVGRRFSGHDFIGDSPAGVYPDLQGASSRAQLQRNGKFARRHDVLFYSDDASLLDHLTKFIGTSLKAGNAALVVATESHRNSLVPRLQAQGAEIGAAIEQGRFISVDAADAVSTFIINGMLDAVRYWDFLRDLIVRAAEAVKGEQAHVTIFGEGTHLLWAQGYSEAAIQAEGLCNRLVKLYDVDILCGYSLRSVQGGLDLDDQIFERIRAEHSAVYSR